MPPAGRCERCGAALSASAPEGFCPACLLQGGLNLPPAPGQPTVKINPEALIPEEETPRFIGGYQILEEIGHGGMGVVYLAEQKEPVRRRVALKIIKLGMDTKEVIGRFEAERQALALMDHSNIAKVLEAGATDTGRPYFVMELVRGLKITEYCDQHALSTGERLHLFMQVCHAVQHAHQKGVIHRDLKPSNILVVVQDGVPIPKIIDFGIAKATGASLTEKTVFTTFEQVIGTPAYMSPEQAEMGRPDIDTRTDIYSLGVLLYELLTGRTPFEAKDLARAGLEAMRRKIREEEPLRPSTRLTSLSNEELGQVAKHRKSEPPRLIHLVRGDLDWIAMKALEKERERRYDTANGLALDVERYLRHEAILARPPSNLYRFQKLLGRNRGAVLVAGAVSALALALLLTLWSFKKEHAAKAALETLAKAGPAQKVPAAIVLRPAPWVDGEEMRRDLKVSGLTAASEWDSVRADHTKGKNVWRLVSRIGSGGTSLSFSLVEAEADTLKPIHSRWARGNDIDVDTTYGPEHAELRSAGKTEVKKLDLDGPVFDNQEFTQLVRRLPLASGYKVTLPVLASISSAFVPIQIQVIGTETVTVPAGTFQCYKVALSVGQTFWYSTDAHRYLVKYEARSVVAELAAVRCLTLAESIEDLLKERTAETVDEAQYLAAGKSELLARVAQAREVLQLEKEAADLAEKVKLAPAEEKYREALATSRKYWPTDPGAWENDVASLTGILAKEGKDDAAEKVLNETLAVEIGNPSLRTNLLEGRVHFLVRRGRWKEAAADCSQLIEFQPDNHLYYHELAPLLVQSGDLEGYRRLCARIVAHFAGTNDPMVCERMAKACLILPSSEIDLAAAGKLAQTAVSTGTTSLYFPFYEFAKGLAEYRTGNFASAVEWMPKVLASSLPVRDVEAKLVLAMAQQRLNRAEDARAALAEATADMETQMPKLNGRDLEESWNDWIVARALMKEAKALIEGPNSITK
jgi:serine/threonine protein kinase